MASTTHGHGTTSRWSWSPWLVLVVSLLVTLLSTSFIVWTNWARDQTRFHMRVQETTDQVQSRLGTYVAMLRGASGLFAASDQVTREEFHAYVARLQLASQYPGIQGIGFTVRVLREQIPELIDHMKKTGLSDFRIWPEQGAEESGARHSIVYLEPLDRRNRAAIGYDMFTEPRRREAMERARDGGEPAATGKVTLVQEIDPIKQPGFLIYVPVYRNGQTPSTVAQRREALEGFVYSPFRADDLLRNTAEEHRSDIGMTVYDGSAAEAGRLLHRSTQESVAQPRFTETRTIMVAGRPWLLVYHTLPTFHTSAVSSLAGGGFLLGLGVSVLLFGITRSLAQARMAAEDATIEAQRSEEAMRDSERRLRLLIDQSPLSIQIFDTGGNSLSVNEAWTNIWRTSRQAAAGYNILEDRQVARLGLMPQIRRAFDGETVFVPAFFYDPAEIGRNGRQRWVELTLYAVRDAQGTIGHVVALTQDVTERKQAAALLQRSEERYRSLVLATSQVVWVTNAEGEFVEDIPGWRTYTGQSESQVKSDGWVAAIHPEDQARVQAGWRQAVSRRAPYETEFRLKLVDGTYRHMLARAVPVLEGDGRVREWVGTWTDITHRKEAEEALKAVNEELERRVAQRTQKLREYQDQLRSLASDLTLSEQRERRKVAQELHDELGQLLASAKMRLGGLRLAVADAQQSRLAEVEEILGQAISSVRTLTFELSPPILYELGLIAATAWLAEQMESRHGLDVLVAADHAAEPEVEDVKVFLFQAIRELLFNVVKHAKTDHAEIRIERAGEYVRVTVQDRGQGYQATETEAGAASRTGFGLFSIRERLSLLGGQFTIEAEPGKGTKVVLLAPLKAAGKRGK